MHALHHSVARVICRYSRSGYPEDAVFPDVDLHNAPSVPIFTACLLFALLSAGFAEKAAPEVKRLSPADGETIHAPNPHFEWTRLPDARLEDRHQIQIATDASFTTIVREDTVEVVSRYGSSGTQIVFEELHGRSYFPLETRAMICVPADSDFKEVRYCVLEFYFSMQSNALLRYGEISNDHFMIRVLRCLNRKMVHLNKTVLEHMVYFNTAKPSWERVQRWGNSVSDRRIS